MPPTPRASVGPARSRINPATGWPLRNDVPRSPRTAPATKPAYCARKGRSVPNACRIRAMSSALGADPWKSTTAGSPVRRMPNATKSEIAARTASAPPALAATKRITRPRLSRRHLQQPHPVARRCCEPLHPLVDAPQVHALPEREVDREVVETPVEALERLEARPLVVGRALRVKVLLDVRVGEDGVPVFAFVVQIG